jgi:predicted ATPase
LYGREDEVDALLSRFNKVASGGREVVYIGGYSGVGKTSLVREVYKSITARRGYFISGKFNQFQRGVPYKALLDAVRDLVKQLLTEDEKQLVYWRERLQPALGINGELIINAIPDAEIIIGPQPPVPALEPTETQNRINLVFRNFLSVFCEAHHPLVIFLDDLQWVDSASLKFLTYLLSDDSIRYLMVIGTFRDNEVDQAHPLMINLKRLKESGVSVDTLRLKPLKSEHVVELVSEALRSKPAEVQALAEMIVAKTDGNPFFIEEFLKSLHLEKLLSFDAQRGSWEWDIDRIRARGIADNVVDLMTVKLGRLNSETKRLVSLAACLGNRFDIFTLSTVYQKPVEDTINTLRQALQLGLIDPLQS